MGIKTIGYPVAHSISQLIEHIPNIPRSYDGFHSHGRTPKWMVYFMENPIKMDDLGVALFQEPPNMVFLCFIGSEPSPIVMQSNCIVAPKTMYGFVWTSLKETTKGGEPGNRLLALRISAASYHPWLQQFSDMTLVHYHQDWCNTIQWCCIG